MTGKHLVIIFLFIFSFSSYGAKPPISDQYRASRTIAFSKDASLGQRWQAIQEMGATRSEASQKDLVRALKANEWYVRNAALIAIQSHSPKFVRQWSEKLLFDKALVVRTQAIKNLLELESLSSAPEIVKALNHSMNFRGKHSLWIRPYLAKALALYPPKNWKVVYQKMLFDKDLKVQSWAIVGLEKKSGLRLGRSDDSLEQKRQKWVSFFKVRRG